MEIRQLTTFSMVAHTLSFSRTAEALNYVQSSVTAQVQALEEELGVRLFDRMGKHVTLTDAGRRLQLYAEKILDQVSEARNAVTEEEIPTGTVTISAPESLCTYRLPILLHRFRMDYPQSRLIFRPCLDCAQLRRHVSDGLIDVAFVIDEFVPSRAHQTEQLQRDALLILAAPDYPLAERFLRSDRPLESGDFQSEHFLLTEQGCSYRNAIEQAFRAEGVDAVTDLAFSSVAAIKQCTMAGMGLAFLPLFTVASELEQGRLVALPWQNHSFDIGTYMVWHKDKWLSPSIRAFLDVARQTLMSE
jgi:DNA-binding transcriptional LysR family regulator